MLSKWYFLPPFVHTFLKINKFINDVCLNAYYCSLHEHSVNMYVLLCENVNEYNNVIHYCKLAIVKQVIVQDTMKLKGLLYNLTNIPKNITHFILRL